MKQSCENCDSLPICKAYIKLYEAVTSSEFSCALEDGGLRTAARVEIFQATATKCSYYQGGGD